MIARGICRFNLIRLFRHLRFTAGAMLNVELSQFIRRLP
jgi:hypothetical protein